mmetsp:Transcript_43759/g.75584  ORF Transcript_43759/g.75584 Transcript_43759/m.75584 type:complete len:298 (+) Transcript_43759:1-894(+)
MYRLSTSANFFFMWLLRSKLTDYQQFRSRTSSVLMTVYWIACYLHFISNIATVCTSWYLGSSYSETCDGEWLYIPLGSESVHSQTCTEETCVSESAQQLVELLCSLIPLFELSAALLMLFLFWAPFRNARYQNYLSHTVESSLAVDQSCSTAIVSHDESFDFAEQLQIAQSAVQSAMQEGQAQAAIIAQMVAQAQAAGAHMDMLQDQQRTLTVLYFNLMAACIAQIYDVGMVSYVIYSAIAYQRVNFRHYEIFHFFDIFLFVAYYSLVFRDHKWLRDMIFAERQTRRVMPGTAENGQ